MGISLYIAKFCILNCLLAVQLYIPCRELLATSKKQQQFLMWSTLCLHIFLPSLPDYNVKMLKFAFYGGRKQATTKFFFLLLNLDMVFALDSRRVCLHRQSKKAVIIPMKIEKNANSLFKRRFCHLRRPRILSFLFMPKTLS